MFQLMNNDVLHRCCSGKDFKHEYEWTVNTAKQSSNPKIKLFHPWVTFTKNASFLAINNIKQLFSHNFNDLHHRLSLKNHYNCAIEPCHSSSRIHANCYKDSSNSVFMRTRFDVLVVDTTVGFDKYYCTQAVLPHQYAQSASLSKPRLFMHFKMSEACKFADMQTAVDLVSPI